MYFAKKVILNQNGHFVDKTNYKELSNQAIKGNIPILLEEKNWNVSKNGFKISLTGGL
jgi:hypothetical protein